MALLVVDQGGGFTKAMVDAAGGTRVLRDCRGSAAFDSVVYRQDDGSWIVGSAARQMSRVFPDRGVRDYKRHLGTQHEIGLGLTSRGASAVMLGEMKRMAEEQTRESLDGVVLLKPASWTDAQTSDMIAAAADAGLRVIGVITESSASVLSVIDDRPLPPGVHMVLCMDLGSTTFDVSLVQVACDQLTVIAADGVSPLGGEDLTGAVRTLTAAAAAALAGRPVDFSVLSGAQQHQLMCDLDEAKLQLSGQATAVVPVPMGGAMRAIKVQRTDYEQEARKILLAGAECVRKMLASKGIAVGDLAQVVYSGAPMNSEFVRAFFDGELGVRGVCASDPSLSGVSGGLLHARALAQKDSAVTSGYLPPSTTIVDCTTYDIGVAVVSFQGKDRSMLCRVLVPKGTAIPCSPMRVFKPESVNQTMVVATYLQGDDGKPVKDCQVLGTAELPIPPQGVLSDRLEVTVNVDHSSMAEVTLRDLVSGNSKTVTLKPPSKGAW